MKKQTLSAWVFPLALLGLAALTYAPLLNQFGLYWDDWVFAWTRSQLGLQGLRDLFEITRPIRGWIEALLTPLLGISLLRWQVYTLLMRGLASVSFWWFLRQLWPERDVEAFFAASLLLVYPGFTQQPQAMTFHYYWTFQGFLFLSFGLMVRAFKSAEIDHRVVLPNTVHPNRNPIWWMYALSLGLSALQLASMEYLLGLEILRPILLWLALSSQFPVLKERFKRMVLYEIPFALALVVYLYWRFVLYSHSIYSPVLFHDTSSSPVATLGGLLNLTLNAIYTVSIQAWLQIFQLLPQAVEQFQGGGMLGWIYALVVFVILGAWVVLGMINTGSGTEDRKPAIAWSWIWLGFGGMFVAGLPFFIAGLPVKITFPENRFSLPFIPLIGLFVAGLLSLIPGRSRKFFVAGVLLALSAGFQIQTADIYRDQYKLDKSFFWQLAWRAPGLKPGTTVLSQDDKTFLFDDDEALTIPLNWMYAPAQHSEPLLYKYQFISIRLEKTLDDMLLASGTGSVSQAVVVRYVASSCLHVLDPVYDRWLLSLPHAGDVRLAAAIGMPFVPEYTLRALPLSNPSQILPQVSPPLVMPSLLGAEPEHRWCFYYQKADLARQQGDWETVARLGDQAFAVPLQPDDLYEYLPFIEAYTRLGRIKDARLLTRQSAENMTLLRPALCAIWMRAQQAGVPAEAVAKMKSELQSCPVQ